MSARCVLVAWIVLPLAAGVVAAEAARAQPVAIVTETDGAAHIVAHGRTVRPDVSDPVEEGALIVLERDARIVLAYPVAGSIYELRGPGRFIARRDSVQVRDAAGRLVQRDLVSALRALRIRPEGTTLQASAAMRGAGTLELQAEGPTGSQLARDAIRVCWRPLGAAWSYRFRLIDDDGAVLFESDTRAAAFELPASVELRAGAPYLWHVMALGPDGQSAEAAGEFRRLDPQREQALLQAEAAIAPSDATGRALVRIARRQLGFVPDGPSGCVRAGGD